MPKLRTPTGVKIWKERKQVALDSGMVGDVKLPLDMIERRKKRYPDLGEMVDVIRASGIRVTKNSINNLEKGKRTVIRMTAFVAYLRLLDLDVRVRNINGKELPDEDLAYPKRKVDYDANEQLEPVRHLLVPVRDTKKGPIEPALRRPVAWVRKAEPVEASEPVDQDTEERIVSDRIRKAYYRKRKQERDRARSGQDNEQPAQRQ